MFIVPDARLKPVSGMPHCYPRREQLIGRGTAPRNKHDEGVNTYLQMLVAVSRSGRTIAFESQGPISNMVIATPSAASVGIMAVRGIRRNLRIAGVNRAGFGINMGAHKTLALVEFEHAPLEEPSCRRSYLALKSYSNRVTARKLFGTSATNDLSPRL